MAKHPPWRYGHPSILPAFSPPKNRRFGPFLSSLPEFFARELKCGPQVLWVASLLPRRPHYWDVGLFSLAFSHPKSRQPPEPGPSIRFALSDAKRTCLHDHSGRRRFSRDPSFFTHADSFLDIWPAGPPFLQKHTLRPAFPPFLHPLKKMSPRRAFLLFMPKKGLPCRGKEAPLGFLTLFPIFSAEVWHPSCIGISARVERGAFPPFLQVSFFPSIRGRWRLLRLTLPA